MEDGERGGKNMPTIFILFYLFFWHVPYCLIDESGDESHLDVVITHDIRGRQAILLEHLQSSGVDLRKQDRLLHKFRYFDLNVLP